MTNWCSVFSTTMLNNHEPHAYHFHCQAVCLWHWLPRVTKQREAWCPSDNKNMGSWERSNSDTRRTEDQINDTGCAVNC